MKKDDEIIIHTNKYQTPVTRAFLEEMSPESQADFLEFATSIPFIKWMISPDRPRCCDLPRDAHGRAIIDITKPPILEDMDYFRPSAKFFEENGCYTFLKPNPRPGSEYRRWFEEEVRRCREGYVRESDGQWITGYNYFYLNYGWMKIVSTDPVTGISAQVESLPKFWEGIYLRYHYHLQARLRGEHCAELARRGCSKSYCLASDMTHNLLLGENEFSKTAVNSILTAATKEYLAEKDGTLNKFVIMKDFCALNTEFPRLLSRNSPSEMLWKAGYIDKNGNAHGSNNIVMGVSIADDEGKVRGKRGQIYFEEMGNFPRLKEVYNNVRDSVKDGDVTFAQLQLVGCCCAGTTVYDEYGKPKNIEDVSLGDKLCGYDSVGSSVEDVTYIQEPAYKDCVRIEARKGVYIECSNDHPILVRSHAHNGTGLNVGFKRADEIEVGDCIMTSRFIGKFGTIHEDHAYLLGALFGDGNYSTGSSPTLSAPTIEEFEYWDSHYDIGVSKVSKCDKFYAQIYIRGIKDLIRKYGWQGLSKDKKELPYNIFEWDKESLCEFLGGYFNADGNVQIVKKKHRAIKLSCKYEKTLIIVKALLHKLGISSHILKEYKQAGILRSNVNNAVSYIFPSDSYVLYICNSSDIITFRNNIRIIAKSKKERLDSYIAPERERSMYDDVKFLYRNDFKKGEFFIGKRLSNMMAVTVTSVESIGKQRIYNLTANTTHTYITNTIISSNTSGDKDSDFAGAKEILYHPDKYDIYSLPNVYDLPGKGTDKFAYFFPAYISRTGCMDKDGNSDVTLSLKKILMARDKAGKKGDATRLRVTAERPITPSEAMMRVKDNYFPVIALTERLRQLESDPRANDDVYIGELVDVNGELVLKATDDVPLRQWRPMPENKRGALEIWEMPVKGRRGEVMKGRYVIAVDPVDNDNAESESLFSCFVFDMFTDRLVAEFTGRRPFAEDNYEIAYNLTRFYNGICMMESNKKGMYAYFAKRRSVWMLADCPEYLRERQLVKYSMFGSGIKGVSVNGAINNLALEQIKDWLNKLVPVKVREKNPETNMMEEREVEMPMLYTIRSVSLLQELISYTNENNTDRVSALAQAMLYREQFIILYGGAHDETDEEPDVSDDEFFNKGWDVYKSHNRVEKINP